MREFRKTIRSALKDHAMTQAELAKRLSLSQSTVSEYLSGSRPIPEEVEKRISDILKLEPPEPVKTEKVTPGYAARVLGVGVGTIHAGLKAGVFPWGYAVKTSEHKWTYVINSRKFIEHETIRLSKKDTVRDRTV